MSKRSASTKARPEPTERVGMTAEELPVEARIRLENAGRWVAWAEDDQSILAVADTHAEVREAARRAGFDRAVCEWLPPVPTRPIGR